MLEVVQVSRKLPDMCDFLQYRAVPETFVHWLPHAVCNVDADFYMAMVQDYKKYEKEFWRLKAKEWKWQAKKEAKKLLSHFRKIEGL